METSKYYTPSLEEFYIGFECEFFNRMQENEWMKEMCDADTLSIALDSYEHGTIEWGDDFTQTFRVKYLNIEDIESLGFTYIKTHPGTSESCFEKKDSEWGLDFDPEWNGESFIRIYVFGFDGDTTSFSGIVKNKSELKRILKMIGVIGQ